MEKSVNEKFIELVKENPDLPIKTFISGECHDEDACWFVGDIYRCEVAEIAEYEPTYAYASRCYTKEDIDEIIEDMFERIADDYEDLSNEEIEKIAKEKAEGLEWQKVILIYVGV